MYSIYYQQSFEKIKKKETNASSSNQKKMHTKNNFHESAMFKILPKNPQTIKQTKSRTDR